MDFVIIANAWSAGADNPTSKHRIALELARRGNRILWLEGAGMRSPSIGSGSDRGRIIRKIALSFQGARQEHPGKIWILTPLPVPLPKLGMVRCFNGWLYRTLARRWCRRLDFKEPVLINYVPVLADAMKNWHSRPVVYHCVDKWDSFEMYDSAMMRKMDEQCCRNAHLVIVSSSELLERCSKLNPNSHLVMHGVDHSHFARAIADEPGKQRPSDLPEGRIVGFFGLLSEWLDQELLIKLARALQSTGSSTPGGTQASASSVTEPVTLQDTNQQPATSRSLVLIGTADVPVDRLKSEPNIFMLGPKPFSELPRYIRHFDIGIIPFVVNDLTRAVNPIKLREMLAAGCPVVSTALPEVERIAQCGDPSQKSTFVVHKHDEFLETVEERLNSSLSTAERRRISDSMTGETWQAKVSEILGIITGEGQARMKDEG